MEIPGRSVSAGFEFGAEAAVDAFGDAGGAEFWFGGGEGVEDEPPCVASLGGGLRATAFARNVNDFLRVRKTFVLDKRALRRVVARNARAVAALGADEVFDAVFVPDEVDADPILQIHPFPTEHELADRGMFGEEDAAFPRGGGLGGAGGKTDGRAGGVGDGAPIRLTC